jgi:tetratricopeptide (TPR) repeat protein
MTRILIPALLAAVIAAIPGCGPSGGAGRPAASERVDELYTLGHQYYTDRNLDSAAAMLGRAVEVDSGYVPALSDLAEVQYARGMELPDEKNPTRLSRLRVARTLLARLEGLGDTNAVIYDRLCELSVALEDNRGFLRYARRYADKFPYDRQFYNLGVAQYQNGDYAAAAKTMKTATDKFKASPYLAGFYREMGLAYMKLDRDQTAVRTLESGLSAADSRLVEMKKSESSPTDIRRVNDDRTGILMTLRKLYVTYKDQPKLENVERLLREAGYPK